MVIASSSLGEVNERTKESFLAAATALIFLIDWPEPFGLVMIEAMACGTPVVAFRRGAVPEVIEHGVSGFVLEPGDEDGALRGDQAAGRARSPSGPAAFEQRFTARRMVDDYLRIYKSLLASATDRHGGMQSTPLARATLPSC